MNVRVYVENPKRRFCLKTKYGNETILEVNQDSPHLLCHRSAYFDVTCRSPNGMKLNVCKNEHNFVKLEPFLTKSLFSNFRRSTTPTNARGKLLRPHLSQKCREGDSQCPSPSPPPSPPASHLLLHPHLQTRSLCMHLDFYTRDAKSDLISTDANLVPKS